MAFAEQAPLFSAQRMRNYIDESPNAPSIGRATLIGASFCSARGRRGTAATMPSKKSRPVGLRDQNPTF
jgi:hypothetical protein